MRCVTCASSVQLAKSYNQEHEPFRKNHGYIQSRILLEPFWELIYTYKHNKTLTEPFWELIKTYKQKRFKSWIG